MRGRRPLVPGRSPSSRPVGRRPILLVHGQPGRGEDWQQVIDRLGRPSRVLAPDRPGYDGRPALSMAANATELAELLGEGGPRAIVVGHSYGGGIALLLAARWPQRVAGLVLVASIGGEGSVVAVDRVLAAPMVGPTLSTAALVASAWIGPRLRRRLTGLGLGPAQVLARYLPDDGSAAALADAHARRSFAVEQRALVAELPAVRQAAAAVRCPVVVVVGTRDRIVPPKAGARLAASIPGSALWSVAGAGHFLPHDAPGTVARAVATVSAELSRRPPRT